MVAMASRPRSMKVQCAAPWLSASMPDAAAAREEIEQPHAVDARAEDVEKGRLDAVEDRPRPFARHDKQLSSSR